MALVTAERLHRWKCAFCGSKDKNIVNIKCKINDEDDSGYDNGVKIVACNQCGHVEFFAHSSALLGSLIGGNVISLKKSEEFVKKQHMENHANPSRNPHSVNNIPHSKIRAILDLNECIENT